MIKNDHESCGTFWEYNSKPFFEEKHAYFYERYCNDLSKHSYPPHWEYYRMIPIEEHNKLNVKFNMFKRDTFNELKKGG